MSIFRSLGTLVLLFILTLALGARTLGAPDAPATLQSLLHTANLDSALRDIDARIRQDQRNAQASNVACRLYFQVENWDEAIRACEKAAALDSQNSEFHEWLGRSYGLKAENVGALRAFTLVRKVKAEFERAVSLGSDNVMAHADLAEFYIEAPSFMGGDKAKARKLAETVSNRDAAEAHYMLARLEEKLGARNKAESEFKSAIETSGNLAHYWVDLAGFYRRTGRLNDMEATINTAREARLSDGIALFDGATVLLQAGRNFPAAVEMFRQYLSSEKFAEDGPAFLAHYRLGTLFEKQGKSQDAAREYRAALALASRYRPAQDALARVSR